MEYSSYMELYKKAKKTYISTAGIVDGVSYARHKRYGIRCVTAGQLITGLKGEKGAVLVQFKEPHKLTVFEAGLLYLLFIENKLPADYGAYHSCKAGYDFIENIESIKVSELDMTPRYTPFKEFKEVSI